MALWELVSHYQQICTVERTIVIDVGQLLTSTHNNTVFQVYLLVLVVLLLATSLNITSADLWRDR